MPQLLDKTLAAIAAVVIAFTSISAVATMPAYEVAAVAVPVLA